MYAYGQLEHFEYIAMEILGLSVTEHLNRPGAGVMLTTVIRIVDQVVRKSKFGASEITDTAAQLQDSSISTPLGIVPSLTSSLLTFSVHLINRQSKSSTLEYPSLFLIGQPSKYDPLKDRRVIIGSVSWASLNSHNGIGR